MMTRCVRTTVDENGNPVGVDGICSWSRVGMQFGNEIVVRIEADDLQHQKLKANPAITILPSLTAPAEALTPELASWFEANGAQRKPGDTVLNLLRQLRDKQGISHLHVDISLPY